MAFPVTDIDDFAAICSDGNVEFIMAHYVPVQGGTGTATAMTASASRLHDLWQWNRYPSSNNAIPGAVAQCDKNTIGALNFTNPAGGRQKLITGVMIMPTTSFAGTIILADRLLHVGGLSGTGAGAQTVGGTIPRYTTAAESQNNFIMYEVYTAIGASTTTIACSYTKEDGVTSGRTTKSIAIGGGTRQEVTRSGIFPLQDTDRGVRAVASATLAATTSTAGNFGITVFQKLMHMQISQATPLVINTLSQLGYMPEIKTDACLQFMAMPDATTLPEFTAIIATVEK